MVVRVQARRGEVEVPRGEELAVDLYLADGEVVVGFEARPSVLGPQDVFGGAAPITWRWKAYVVAPVTAIA